MLGHVLGVVKRHFVPCAPSPRKRLVPMRRCLAFDVHRWPTRSARLAQDVRQHASVEHVPKFNKDRLAAERSGFHNSPLQRSRPNCSAVRCPGASAAFASLRHAVTVFTTSSLKSSSVAGK
jgi:hypothetical protein